MSLAVSERVEELFLAATDLDPQEQDAFLRRACGSDEALRKEVRSLLTASNRAKDYFHTLANRFGLTSIFEGDLERLEQDVIGAYRLIRLLGRGGMGAVYLAERADEQFEKQVALKVLPFGVSDEEAKARFFAERQILAHLEHPGIARLLDGGVTERGTPYFVMEYVAGQHIDLYCDEQRLDVDARLELFSRVCDAVQFAHSNLVVHRDLKPSNILVTESREVRLVDFGIAKLVDTQTKDATLTRMGRVPMTPAFASPEMARGETVTTGSDVYALGVLLFGLLSGHTPYRLVGLSDEKVRETICYYDPPPASGVACTDAEWCGKDDEKKIISALDIAEARATTPVHLRNRLRGDLDTILAKALRKEIDQRYRSVEQFAEDIRRYQEGLPIVARAPTLSYRAAKFVGRHKAGVGAAALVAAALIAVAGLTTLYAVTTAEHARQIAAERDKAEQIKDFMLSIFELSGPNQTKGKTITARELLDRGTKRVRSELGGQPGRQAVLLSAIAKVYSELSLFDEAKPLLEEASRLYLETSGETSADYAETIELLALNFELQGAYDDAERLAKHAIEIRGALGDLEPLAKSLLRRGAIQHRKGLLDEAEALYREALRIQREHYPEDREAIAQSLSNMGALLEHRDHLDAAEAMHREALSIRRALYGEEHTILIESLYNLGSVLRKRSRYDDARGLFEEALAIGQKLQPEGDHGEAFLYGGLANVLESMGELELAETRYRQSLDVVDRYFGDDHPNAGIVMGNLGRVACKQGDAERAVSWLHDGIATLSAAVPAHHHLPIMRLDLGRCLLGVGEYEEAETPLLNSHAALEERWGNENDQTQAAIQALVELYEAWDKPTNAAQYRKLRIDGSSAAY